MKLHFLLLFKSLTHKNPLIWQQVVSGGVTANIGRIS